jgi:hypothetical protein
MKKSLLAILVALVLGSGVASADLTSSASAVVSVNVVSNVAVGVVTGLVNLGNIQTGPFSGSIIFRVDANLQVIDLSVAVSNLYKDDAPTSAYFIPVYVLPGVAVVPVIGSELPAGEDNVLPYVTTPIFVGPYAGLATVFGVFGSGQNNHFSQEVVVTPSWIQLDPELPTGEYSGLVILTAVLGAPA